MRFPRSRHVLLLSMGWTLLIGTAIFWCRSVPGPEGQARAAAGEDEPLRWSATIAVPDDMSARLLFIAAEQGLFRRHGLSVTFSKFPRGEPALEALIAGKVLIAAVPTYPVANRLFRHQDVGIAYALASSAGSYRVVARADRGIAHPADLQRKSIATQEGSTLHHFLQVFLRAHDLPLSAVHMVKMEPDEACKALIEGRIDAFAGTGPQVTRARFDLLKNAISFPPPEYYTQHTVLAVRRAAVPDPSAMQALTAAIEDARQLVERDREAAKLLVARALGRERMLEIQTQWDCYRDERPAPREVTAELDREARWMFDMAADLPPLPDFRSVWLGPAVTAGVPAQSPGLRVGTSSQSQVRTPRAAL